MIDRRLLASLTAAALLAVWLAPAAAQQVPRRGMALPQAEETQPAPEPRGLRRGGTPRAAPVPSVSAAPLQADGDTLVIPQNSAQSLELPEDASDVVIANETIADVRASQQDPRKIFVIARGVGSTEMYVSDAEGTVLRQWNIRVDLNPAPLRTALAELLPDTRVKVSAFQSTVYLSGRVRSARLASNVVDIVRNLLPDSANVINMLEIQGRQQVILKVRVAEVSRTLTKNLETQTPFSSPNFLRGRTLNFTPDAVSGDQFAQGSLRVGLPFLNPTQFDVLEQQNLVQTLAEPTLVALSGETASFLSGGQTPVPSGTDENGNTVVSYRDFGVRLNFTPMVQDEGLINLQVETEISSLGNLISVGNTDAREFDSKNTSTTIDLPSGGGLMISGLLQDDLDNTIEGVPYLKDIPILGALFRSTAFQKDQSELVVLVRAYLARPVDGKDGLRSPTDGLAAPTDADLYLLGRLHREYVGGKDVPFWKRPFEFDGPFGYIMERLP